MRIGLGAEWRGPSKIIRSLIGTPSPRRERRAKSTLPDTRSIGPDTAMGSPIFIYRRILLGWFEVEWSFDTILEGIIGEEWIEVG
jgi:hypothetical protein